MSDEVRIPLGELEDQHLEFKAAAVLDSPEKVGREVVGMLNADGGQVWIGLREEEGRAVEIDLISDVERVRNNLLNSLVDSLSPSLDHREVKVEVVSLPDSQGRGLLQIQVTPSRSRLRRPYALVSGASYSFHVRVGARLRPMAREEIFKREQGTSDGDARRRAEKVIKSERDKLLKSGKQALWLRIQPIHKLELDVTSPLFEDLASKPERSNNRPAGYAFTGMHFQAKSTPGRVSWQSPWGSDPIEMVTFEPDGTATFLLSLEAIVSGREVNPYHLMEYPVSALRIGSVVFEESGNEGPVLVALGLFGSSDLSLRPVSARGRVFGVGEPHQLIGEVAYVEKDFSATEFQSEPDRCGFRLLGQLYQDFGLNEEGIPPDFDRTTGRLVLSV